MAAKPPVLTAVKPDDDIGRGGRWVGGMGEACKGGGSAWLIELLKAIEAASLVSRLAPLEEQIEAERDGLEATDAEILMVNTLHCTRIPSVDGLRVWHILAILRKDATNAGRSS